MFFKKNIETINKISLVILFHKDQEKYSVKCYSNIEIHHLLNIVKCCEFILWNMERKNLSIKPGIITKRQ